MKDGRTAGEHVRSYAKRDPVGGAAALRDVTPGPIPACAVLAVEAFEMLSATRGGGMSGPKPITLSDVQSYTVMLQQPLSPREVRWVLEQDAAYLSTVAETMANV
jgi:hypothetical protein